MIELFIYHIHILGVVYAYTKRWQTEGVKSGLMAVVLCGLVFVIVWALMGPLARLVMPGVAAPGTFFTSDTLSLVFTLIPECVFFWVFFVRKQVATTPS